MDNVPTTGLTDRLILHAKTLDEVAVFDADGTELASARWPLKHPDRARERGRYSTSATRV